MARNSLPTISTAAELKRFLSSLGYVPAEILNPESGSKGKGSHTVWSHPEMARLARQHNVQMPPNLRSHGSQQACNVMTCESPGKGTMMAIVKQAVWCRDKINEIHRATAFQPREDKLRKHMSECLRDVRDFGKTAQLLRSAFGKVCAREGAVVGRNYYDKDIRKPLRHATEMEAILKDAANRLKNTLDSGMRH